PYRIVNREDDEIEFGNPDLDPTRSMNFDIMAEHYLPSLGIISGGAFLKDIKDFRYKRLYIFEDPEFEGFEAEQPVNGNNALLAGFEINWQQQLDFLPGFAKNFGIFANYTYTWSEAEVLGETSEETRTVTLPGQSKSSGNAALSYQKGGFNGRISANYAGAFVDELRDDSGNDRYYDERLQVDISASQQITKNLSVFAEGMNLTNAPLRYYNGVTARPEQQEFYSFWVNFGIKYDL
uniref:TonB-dependent receptor domain-containing protein n=1 Tax=Salegentibacter sp. TaxID=1903072 RepID=UPI0035626E71